MSLRTWIVKQPGEGFRDAEEACGTGLGIAWSTSYHKRVLPVQSAQLLGNATDQGTVCVCVWGTEGQS